MDHVVSENLTVVEPSESGGVGEFFSGGDGGFSEAASEAEEAAVGRPLHINYLVTRSRSDSHVADTKSDCDNFLFIEVYIFFRIV